MVLAQPQEGEVEDIRRYFRKAVRYLRVYHVDFILAY